jgi:16S rRNA (guanine(966)-N(2))-methyltransferase RsmD
MLKISGGAYKGLRIDTPGAIRATSTKVRQALFNILGDAIADSRVVDGFAGSGALGLEALSRGAAFVAFIETETEGALAIRDNLERLAPDLDRSAWRLLHMDIERGLRELADSAEPFDLILLDPPYRTDLGEKALNTVVDCAILAPAGLVVVEHDQRTALPASVGPLRQRTRHRYGDTVLSFYHRP